MQQMNLKVYHFVKAKIKLLKNKIINLNTKNYINNLQALCSSKVHFSLSSINNVYFQFHEPKSQRLQ